ncbi:MAG: hypothetical protein ACI9CE_002810 [Flavobacterium sp.]|jgi:hypothetical protein
MKQVLIKQAVIKRATVAAAHDGDAELIIEIVYASGAVSEISLDSHASNILMKSCAAKCIEDLTGHSWEKVKDALQSSYNRFQDAAYKAPDFQKEEKQ